MIVLLCVIMASFFISIITLISAMVLLELDKKKVPKILEIVGIISGGILFLSAFVFLFWLLLGGVK